MKRAALWIAGAGFIVGAVGAGACGKSGGGAASAGGDCQQAIDHALMVSDPTKGMDPKQAAALKPMMAAMAKTGVERCLGDQWKSDVTGCMKKASTSADLNKCQDALTPAQHKSFDDALAKTASANMPAEVAVPAVPVAPAAAGDGSAAAGSAAGSGAAPATPTP